MSLNSCLLLRRICSIRGQQFSTAFKHKESSQTSEESVPTFRTSESNPIYHDESHLNRFYTIPEDIRKQIFQYGGLTRTYTQQVETFNECSLLVRKPALEIISYLKRTDYTKPVNKYVIYGPLGYGKSTTMVHVVHYAFLTKHLLIHVPAASRWFEYPQEIATSPQDENLVDLPIDAEKWLIHFRHQNAALLMELDLRLSQDYKWTQRESNSKGSPLTEMIDFGINRIKFSCGVINALINELKIASTAGQCKTLVAINEFNAFLSEVSNIRGDRKVIIPPNKVSLTHYFMNLTKYDWCNGAIVLIVDTHATKDRRESFYPRYLLGKEGFEHLDPFLPVEVDKYTKDEFETVIEYYKNRKWIRNITPIARTELYLLSDAIPLKVMQCCTPL